MSTTAADRETANGAAPGTIDMKLEVVTLPVSDPERAKAFYTKLGWRLDADLSAGDEFRAVQMTPPHSQCSIHFGKGIPLRAAPGTLDRLFLAVEDIEAARNDIISRGVEVGEIYEQHPPGLEHIEGRSYFMYASFNDPDGNEWLLQEISTRFPGREWDE
jgi:catechol 2,3-dioxygenase-like lactoylglutathione lyase family enzyme